MVTGKPIGDSSADICWRLPDFPLVATLLRVWVFSVTTPYHSRWGHQKTNQNPNVIAAVTRRALEFGTGPHTFT